MNSMYAINLCEIIKQMASINSVKMETLSINNNISSYMGEFQRPIQSSKVTYKPVLNIFQFSPKKKNEKTKPGLFL